MVVIPVGRAYHEIVKRIKLPASAVARAHTTNGTSMRSPATWRLSAVALSVVVLALSRPAGADPIAADKLPEAPLVNPATGAEGEYVEKLHAHIHRRWAGNFLRLAAEKLPGNNPLNSPALVAVADIVVTPDGQLISAKLARSSGFPGFDDAVIEVLRDAVPYPLPPASLRSDDDKLHAQWTFARDQRRCAGLAFVRTYDPVEVAVPKLLRSGRRAEALNRLVMARGAGVHAEPTFTLVAQDWIKASLHEPWATVRLAQTLAARNDEAAIQWLKNALRRPELAPEAAAALVALKIPVCPLVKTWFDSQNWTDHEVAANVLATAGDADCAPGLLTLLANTKARPEARVAAATALGPIDHPDAKKALATAAKEENNVKVRAAAILAGIRPNAGRGKVISVVPFLRDPAPELRAAAAAGVVRAGGDANLDDLYVLFKDNDPRPALAALKELERLPSAKATDLIARLARRPHLPTQKLAAELLIRRGARDQYVVLRPFLDPKTDAELRGLALVAADEPTLQAASADPKLGIAPFRARLARGERDQAADWFITRGKALPPPAQAAAMVEWVTTAPPPEPAAAGKPEAVKTPR